MRARNELFRNRFLMFWRDTYRLYFQLKIIQYRTAHTQVLLKDSLYGT